LSPEEALADAIEKAGNASELSRRLNVTPQAVGQWTVCPALRVLDVERITGVSRHDLRPDVYGPAPAEVPA
jgi:DNA-binding transcriptional regulator YdaS (Cro superfamily)